MSIFCWVAFLVVVVVNTIILSVANYILTLDLMYGPARVLTLSQSFPEMLQLFIENLRSSVKYFVSMGESTYDPVLSRKIMMAIPL